MKGEKERYMQNFEEDLKKMNMIKWWEKVLDKNEWGRLKPTKDCNAKEQVCDVMNL